MSESQAPSLTLPELPELRRKTEAVSQLLRQQIATHLETLRPLLGPERIFGKHAAGKIEASGAEAAVSELQQAYKKYTAKPYDLPTDFSTSWLTLIGNALDIYPWEYIHDIQGKAITMSSPVRWAVNYRSNYTLAQAKNALSGKEAPRIDYLRQFVVNALVLQMILARAPGLNPLFADLRYELKTEFPADMKGLPVLTITSCVSSFPPPDDLIIAATAFSGIPAFIELVDSRSISQPKDTLKDKLEELFRT
jgi:hypothetical protein